MADQSVDIPLLAFRRIYTYVGICFCLALMRSNSASAVRILSIPQNVNSHYIDNGRLLLALTGEGHEATMFMASNAKVPDFLRESRVQVVKYKVNYEVPFMNTEECSKLFIGAAMTESTVERLKSFHELADGLLSHWRDDCLMMIENQVLKDHLKTNKYDVFLADNAGIDCQPVIALQQNLPIIIYGVMNEQHIYRTPSLPSFIPSMLTQFTDEMSFIQRLQNTLTMVMRDLVTIDDVSAYEKYTPERGITQVKQIFRDSVLYLVLDDPAISYAHPMMPNMAYIGDVIPQPANHLPPAIKQFVEEAKEGVVLVSFGSFVDYMPEDTVQKLCRAFLRLRQKVIWKLKNTHLCEVPEDKVFLLDWLPQNDLLAHPNVKLFVSHCGMNSVLESIYHGTPILGAPIAIDQPQNAGRIEHKGHGLQMAINNFSADEVVEKVEKILTSRRIQENVRKASAVMKDKLVSPAKRASYWVNHVVKYGDRHLRTGAFKLNDLQFFMVDIYFTLLFILVTFVFILSVFMRCCYRCFRRCVIQKQKVE